MWGRRFVDMTYYDELAEVYVTDFDRMDHTESVNMSAYSAQQLNEIHLNFSGVNGIIMERVSYST